MAIDRITETITREKGRFDGQPYVKGTEVTVVAVLDLLAEGIFPQEIVTDKYHPELTLDQIYTCIAFASQALKKVNWG